MEKITRKELTEAAGKICPDLINLVPKYIPEINFWKIAMEKAFLEELTCDSVNILRKGLKQFNQDSFIV